VCFEPVLSDENTRLPVGMGMVVMAEVPLLPSLVAVMVVLPEAAALTRPVGDTVATAGLLVVHITLRPVRTLWATSRVVAVRPSVLPTAIVALVGATVTVATGRASIMKSSVPIPFWPFDVVTTTSYCPTLAVTAIVMFAISSLELANWVALVVTSGETSPLWAHWAFDPRSKPEPNTWTFSVVS
jgi:hypothetical protein